MKFGAVPVDEAEGAILAHSVNLDHPSPRTIRKGRRLSKEDVLAIKGDAITEVTVARLEPGDVHEDAAAGRLAAAIVPTPEKQGIRLTQASTGRVNLYSETAGVLVTDAHAIHAVNRVNPMITVATLPPYRRVAANEMLATVKIISYAVPGTDLERAAGLASAALSVAPPVHGTATLIETSITRDPPPKKGRDALKGRLHRLGMILDERVVVPHETAAIARALTEAKTDMLFVLTASATSDAHDVAPEAVRAAGGCIAHFGMPVDPGNLLFFGQIGQRPVVGLPGCARSPALNGADWVLERLACGLDVTPEDVAAMGVGGLLKEIPIRPQPREPRK